MENEIITFCQTCGKPMKPRKGKRFCSSTCRVQAHFNKQADNVVLSIVPSELEDKQAKIIKAKAEMMKLSNSFNVAPPDKKIEELRIKLKEKAEELGKLDFKKPVAESKTIIKRIVIDSERIAETFLREFVCLHNRTISKAKLLDIIERLQEAIRTKQIRKTSIYVNDIEYMQDFLVNTYNKANKNVIKIIIKKNRLFFES